MIVKDVKGSCCGEFDSYPSISVEELRKITENLSHCNSCPSQDSNPTHLEYVSKIYSLNQRAWPEFHVIYCSQYLFSCLQPLTFSNIVRKRKNIYFVSVSFPAPSITWAGDLA
jgi:hypothetical protein